MSDKAYTRNQPIWWLRRNKPPEEAIFMAYRSKRVVIEMLLPNGDTRRKVAKLEAIQPREEGQQPPPQQEEDPPFDR